MNEFYKLYLPKTQREVKIEVSIPKYRTHISFDTLYFLDGQNAFSDARASFGRSIRATKHLNFAAKEMGKRIIGVAIHNADSEMGRINEYSPFKIDFFTDKWRNNEVMKCFNFCDDLVNTIIPFIESKYDVRPNPENRYIYGSSLAAVTAIYTAFKYPNSFNYVGAFSTASFLFEEALFKFLNKNINTNKKVFLYYGKNEISDQMTLTGLYEDAAHKLYSFFKENNIKTRVVVSTSGEHNEENWDRNFLDFINFIYYDDIIYKK
jgi:predicted alpha/beta superfamily hydrolase